MWVEILSNKCSRLWCLDLSGLKLAYISIKLKSARLDLLQFHKGFSNMCIGCFLSASRASGYSNLTDCGGVDEEVPLGSDAAVLSSGCKNLWKLNLSYCSVVTDKGMKHLSQLQRLSALEIRGHLNITSIGLTAVAAGCRILTELDMERMAMSNLTRLQDVKLVCLNGATLEGTELALWARFVRIKKVKLLSAAEI
ncbi:hypothetical protein MLD38_017822 [Melastoma candidum]|uniref:Uncharacterized protein n=1 Tax=Melastoma candidum TaxID=119954 RepID=A0ACB9QVE5_9MYRT|nr:hypothetical protein MLD38_017822 [Melastoma candidum]